MSSLHVAEEGLASHSGAPQRPDATHDFRPDPLHGVLICRALCVALYVLLYVLLLLTRYMACSYVALSLYVLLLLLHCVTEGRAAQPGVPQHPDRGRVQIRPPVRPLSPEAGSLSPEAGSRPPVRETVIDLLPVLAAYCLKQGLIC